MKFRKITAITRLERSEEVEQALRTIGIPGVSCTHVKGYGEYADYYCSDWKVTHARFEIFVEQERVDEIVDVIRKVARSGAAGDGIIAVLPVEHLYRIRDMKKEDTSGR